MGRPASPRLGEGDRDGEGQSQPVVVGTTACMQPWGYIQPDAQRQAPWVSAISAFLFRQTTSLLSSLGCLRFRESTSAIFGDCVAFFGGKAWKMILCPACLSSVPVGAAKPNGGCGGLGERKLCSRRSEKWD